MGRRGPKPKPTVIKKFEGNPGKRRLPKGEPEPAAVDGDPVPPAWLGAEGQAKWREIVPQLRALGVLTTLDLDVLSTYCASWDEYAQCQKTMNEEGHYVYLESGFVALHPAVSRMQKALERIRKLAAEFGMTPSSRSSLGGSKDKPKGALSKYVS